MRKMAWLLMIVLTLCAAAGAQAEGLTPVKVSEVTHSVFYAPQYIAMSLGYFEEEGLHVEITTSGGSEKAMTALLSGDADLCLAGPETGVYVMNEGKDVTLIATGHMVWETIKAAEALEKEGISAEILDIATIKPLDEEALLASVLKTGAAVVAEEHNSAGGLGELVAGVLARKAPKPLEFINGGDRFGQTGTPAELMAAYGLDAAHIVSAAKAAIARK